MEGTLKESDREIRELQAKNEKLSNFVADVVKVVEKSTPAVQIALAEAEKTENSKITNTSGERMVKERMPSKELAIEKIFRTGVPAGRTKEERRYMDWFQNVGELLEHNKLFSVAVECFWISRFAWT